MGADAVRVAREMAQARDPRDVAELCGARFSGSVDDGSLELVFVGAPVRLNWPDLCLAEGSPALPDHVLALVLYYLGLSDGTRPSGRLTSFAELPDGRFYVQAFRGYTDAPLARAFGADPGALSAAASAIGGEPVAGLGDRAWHFDALPRVPLALVWWDADDEFEARAEIMFDDTARHHLTIDGCAVLGSWVSQMLRR